MENAVPSRKKTAGKWKFIAGGLLIAAAVVYLIVSSTQASAQYFLTIDELTARSSDMTGQSVRVSGAVLGDTIQYDPATLNLKFTLAHIPGDNDEIEAQGGLAMVLHKATLDQTRSKIQVVYNGVKPDLLKNEAQAIMTGKMGADGMFYAEELLLKCPTRYEEAVPEQVGMK